MKKHLSILSAAVAAAQISSAATIDLAVSQDTSVWNRDGHSWQDVNSGSETSIDLHQESNSTINAFGYLQFDLSSLGAITINSATLGISRISPNPVDPGIGSSRSGGGGNWAEDRIDFYGLNNVAGNTAQDWSESTLTFNLTGNEVTESSADNANPFVGITVSDFSTQNTIGNNDSAAGTDSSTLTGATVVSWLQGRVDGNGLVTFLVDTNNSVGFYSKEGATAASLSVAPTLTLDYTPVPEPTVALLGGMGILGLLRRRR